MKENYPVVKIVKVGTICFEPTEIASSFTHRIKNNMGIGGGSSVTLIEADKRIIVDTGFDYEWLDTKTNDEKNINRLVNTLDELEITPEDVDTVFITHWHRDHFGNIDIFNNAKRIASRGMPKKFNLNNFTELDDGEEISEGVRVMFTPGHTENHASIIVNTIMENTKARIAIAGDAVISHSYFHTGNIWRYNDDFYKAEIVRNSILRIIEASDIIIPGHGGPFMTYKPDWLDI